MKFDLILKGGEVINPPGRTRSELDVGVKDREIVELGEDLSTQSAERVIEVTGKVVAPGLIDLHTHLYKTGNFLGLDADEVSESSGVTTLVDAGSAGAGNFDFFHLHDLQTAQCQVKAFLHISYAGIFVRHSIVGVGELCDLKLANVDEAVRVGKKFPEDIVGIKIRVGSPISGSQGSVALELAKRAAEILNKPLMVHASEPPPTRGEVLSRLREGDILTHLCRSGANSILTGEGKVIPELVEAQQRGVVLDIGHGGGNFSFQVAQSMLDQGIKPDVISSDLHQLCVPRPVGDLPTTMTKLLNFGLDLEEVVEATTWNPAKAIGCEESIGNLEPGSPADITVLKLHQEKLDLVDSDGKEMEVERSISPELMIRRGEVVPIQ